MIGRLHGKLLEKNPPQILIDVSGVGYEVDVPMSTFCNLPEVGGELTLYTHFVVREDAELLYGFATLAERAVFRALIKISGVGPKIALALLTKVPGIGKKTAERLVLELKGKLAGTGAATAAVPTSGARADVAAALIALGYSEREAAAATKKLPEDCTVNDGLRLALKSLTH